MLSHNVITIKNKRLQTKDSFPIVTLLIDMPVIQIE